MPAVVVGTGTYLATGSPDAYYSMWKGSRIHSLVHRKYWQVLQPIHWKLCRIHHMQTSHDRGLEGRSILTTRCSLDSNNHNPSGKEVVKNNLLQDCEMYCKMADKAQGHWELFISTLYTRLSQTGASCSISLCCIPLQHFYRCINS